MKKKIFDNISQQELVSQIISKKSAKIKLPTWFNTEGIYYPKKINIEQTSSEATAEFKSNLVSGKSLIDLTGGLGIDSYYFAKKIDIIYHCEIDKNVSKISYHNFKKLGVKNINSIHDNGLNYLANYSDDFDWIYIDPSRRDDVKGKVFLLSDCTPNIVEELDLCFKKSNNILIKVSPILDIQNTIKQLKYVKHIYTVAIKNEVKELLFILEKDYVDDTTIYAVNLNSNNSNIYSFNINNSFVATYSLPKDYLYEPNSALLKSGGFDWISSYFNVNKLHKHSHLYTNNSIIDFPGRRFKIIEILPYNKKLLKKRFGKQQLNITTRNFPKTVDTIRKELNIRNGGLQYLFFTTNINNDKIVLFCDKF